MPPQQEPQPQPQPPRQPVPPTPKPPAPVPTTPTTPKPPAPASYTLPGVLSSLQPIYGPSPGDWRGHFSYDQSQPGGWNLNKVDLSSGSYSTDTGSIRWQPDGTVAFQAKTGERSGRSMIYTQGSGYVREGDDQVYKFSLYIPSNFPTDYRFAQFAQIHPQAGAGVALYMHREGGVDRLGMKVGDEPTSKEIWFDTLQRGQWYDFTWRVRHSEDPAKGYVQAWLGDKLIGQSYGATIPGDDHYNYYELGLYWDRLNTSPGTANILMRPGGVYRTSEATAALQQRPTQSSSLPAYQQIAGSLPSILSGIKQTAYGNENVFDTANGIYKMLCTQFINRMLDMFSPQRMDALRTYSDRKGPTSANYYDFIRSRPLGSVDSSGWMQLGGANLLRAGDIIAVKYGVPRPNGISEGTGHTMYVMGTPVQISSGIWRIRVADSASTNHSNDTRAAGTGGLGIGDILYRSDGSWAWRADAPRWRTDEAVAFGRVM